MKYVLRFVAEWANRQSDKTTGSNREAYNYLGHYALIVSSLRS